MTKRTTLDVWSDICQKLVRSERGSSDWVHPVHSCMIDGQHHYVHAPDLEKSHPEYFRRLSRFAKKHKINLKADRRSTLDNRVQCRRKKLLPIIFLALGTQASISLADSKTSLKLFTTPDSKVVKKDERLSESLDADTRLTDYSIQAEKIRDLLLSHFSPGESDPDNILDEIDSLAKYYAGHPEAVALINSIAHSSWKLKYAPHTFQTDIRGSRLSVDSVTVYFDPRSGAKLKFYDKCSQKKPFCVASPADALLHEFLHVQTVVNDTEAFITQGGLGQHIYPFEHERLTILKENALYKAMTRRDHVPRPARNEHSGRHVLVSCVTCLE